MDTEIIKFGAERVKLVIPFPAARQGYECTVRLPPLGYIDKERRSAGLGTSSEPLAQPPG